MAFPNELVMVLEMLNPFDAAHVAELSVLDWKPAVQIQVDAGDRSDLAECRVDVARGYRVSELEQLPGKCPLAGGYFQQRAALREGREYGQYLSMCLLVRDN